MRKAVWIVDGFNVIRRVSRFRAVEAEQGTPAARSLLERSLMGFRNKAGQGASVVLVYDGAPERDRVGGRGAGMRILHPPRGKRADDVILDEARRAGTTDRVYVVTSDFHDIASRLHGLGVQHVGAEEFAGALADAGAHGEPDDGSEKPSAQSRADVEHWLRRFGGEKGNDAGA